jgi:hypothetical protein
MVNSRTARRIEVTPKERLSNATLVATTLSGTSASHGAAFTVAIALSALACYADQIVGRIIARDGLSESLKRN